MTSERITTEGNLEYAATRVQTQHGRLPAESDWQSVEASQDLTHYLDSARAGVLSTWVSAFDVHQDLHVMERSLRTQWQGHVERVASWHPRDWQAWLRWLSWLPGLPLRVPLARPETAPTWLLSDPTLAPAARTDATGRLNFFNNLATDLTGTAAPRAIALLWRARWDTLAPHVDDEGRAHLAALHRAIDKHAAALPAATSTQALRRQLAQRLEVLYRLSSGTAIATACHLGRLALELERLRGGIASRSLLGNLASAASL